MYYISLFVFALSCCDTRGFLGSSGIDSSRYRLSDVVGEVTQVAVRK